MERSGDTSRWQQLGALFDELSELEPAARAARLAALRSGDAELADELQRMLAADAAASGVLDHGLDASLAGRIVDARAPAEALDRSGETIDEYRLLQRAGRGGMGEVYLAERSREGFTQRVAVKLLRRGVDTEDVIRRFAQERRILAQLEHPGIARLIDGGVAPGGAPYLVMEYVEGEPLVQHAERAALPLEARLKLVVAICDAVDYAHRRLVVHRDLKPSNVLVTPEGDPKLLDFGIAKLLGNTGEETATAADVRVMSPAYAAPEQILGEPIGTATDVYALGVMLYELLTGSLPHDRSGRSIDALARAVDTETIERPSAAVRRRERTLDTTRLARRLDGDLDTIVLHALAREPERRYPSAAALADDLSRYLDGKPIRARPQTWTYRVGKFVNRHRGGVSLALLMLVALLGSLGLALWQARRAQVEASNAAAQAARAERVKDFVLALFREQDPLTRDKAKAATAAELITRGIAAARDDFRDDPALEAEIVGDLAQLQFSLGDVKDARAQFERLVEQRRALDGEDSVAYGVALSELGGAQLALGERDAAGPTIRRAVEILRRRAGPEALETANAEMRLQRLTLEHGDAEAALPIAQRVLAVYTREKGAAHTETLQRRYNLAVVYEQLDRLEEAEAEIRAVIAARERAGEGDHVQLVYPRTLLGDVLRRQRRYEEAATLYDGALATARRELGAEHRLIGQIAMRRGDLLRRLRRYDEGEAALAEAERVFAPIGSPELGQVYVYRGQTYLQQERNAEGVHWYERAVEHYRKTLGPDTVYTRGAELSLAKARANAGEVERGVAEAEAAAAAVRKTAAPGTFEHAFAGESLGEVYGIAGRHEDALAQYRGARDVLAKMYGEAHAGVASVDWAIAKTLVELGRDPGEARERIDRALAVLRDADPDDPDIGEALLTSAALARQAGDAPRAARERAEAAQRLEREYGADHPLTRAAREG
ncbi:MAG TPA: serine/threonine-protein kinase [Xanthomonadales bacterium]|nr:serine/threonine-protein kinase [Xanthomonadales bacterium]